MSAFGKPSNYTCEQKIENKIYNMILSQEFYSLSLRKKGNHNQMLFNFNNKSERGCNRKKELEIGQEIEEEHGLGDKTAKKIAKDHIKEFSCYYSKGLIPMEKRLKKMKGGIL